MSEQKSASRSRLYLGPRPSVALVDVPVGRLLHAVSTVPASSKPLVDLNGKPKLLLVIGAGHSGTTTLTKWIAEQAMSRDPHACYFAAVGERRDLVHSPFSVEQPTDDAGNPVFGQVVETQWLRRLIRHCMTERATAAIDFDGGDLTLMSLVQQQTDLCAVVEAAGIAIVAVYLLTPRLTDLTTLATMQQSGFRPAATMLVLNDGRVPSSSSVGERFGAIMDHREFRTAVDRGSAVIHMPHNPEWEAVEHARMLFGQAAAKDSPLGAFESDRVGHWLAAMVAAFEPVVKAGWLP